MPDRLPGSVLALTLALMLTGCGAASAPWSTTSPHRQTGSATVPSGQTRTTSATPTAGTSPPAGAPTVADTSQATSTTPAAPTVDGVRPTPERPPPPQGLPAEWGVAYLSPEGEVTTLGTLGLGAAWSTLKVPLSVAALREQGADVEAWVHAALSSSDNTAAAQLWTALGPSDLAGAAVDEVLRSLGDPTTTTQTAQVRPPFSAFGQTSWTLEGQVRTARSLDCSDDAAVRTVLDSMGQVVAEQSWGLGRLDGARFKGGWGPGPDGRYLVRQFGLVHLDGQIFPVALAARADDGTFASGTKALDLLADWWAQDLLARSAPTGCAH